MIADYLIYIDNVSIESILPACDGIVHASVRLSGWIGMDIDGLTLDINDESIERLGIQLSEIDSIWDEIIEYANTIMDIVRAKAH